MDIIGSDVRLVRSIQTWSIKKRLIQAVTLEKVVRTDREIYSWPEISSVKRLSREFCAMWLINSRLHFFIVELGYLFKGALCWLIFKTFWFQASEILRKFKYLCFSHNQIRPGDVGELWYQWVGAGRWYLGI